MLDGRVLHAALTDGDQVALVGFSTEGDINFELAAFSFDDFMEAALAGTWTNLYVITASTIAVNTTTNQYTDSGNGLARVAETRAHEGRGAVGIWSWLGEERGEIRERVFVPELGVPEDEATGAAAIQLGARLGRPLRIRQGRGSEMLVRPGPGGTVSGTGTGPGCVIADRTGVAGHGW